MAAAAAIFMGEEISMSARLWTSGYDIFSPTINVLNHYYVRRHYPKFWESVNRYFKKPIHNDLVEIVINRVKCMLGYPESRPEMIHPNNVLFRYVTLLNPFISNSFYLRFLMTYIHKI